MTLYQIDSTSTFKKKKKVISYFPIENPSLRKNSSNNTPLTPAPCLATIPVWPPVTF